MVFTAAVMSTAGVWARQFDAAPSGGSGASEDPNAAAAEAPSVDEILDALKSGRSSDDIGAWIQRSGGSGTYTLSLDEVFRLRDAGLAPQVISAMTEVPDERLEELLASRPARPRFEKPPAKRSGLSKKEILKMIEHGGTEAEVLAAIAEKGSRATLDLDEALELRDKGLSPALLAAMVTSAGPAAAQAAAPAAPAPAKPAAGSLTVAQVRSMWESGKEPSAIAKEIRAKGMSEPPTLDQLTELEDAGLPQEILTALTAAPAGSASPAPAAGKREVPPTLDEALGEEAEGTDEESEEIPTLDEVLGEEEEPAEPERESRVTVLSDPGDARVFVSPGAIRTADIMRLMRSAGSTPAELNPAPGPWLVFVEKKLDDFDRAIVPALRTVHDADGRTRTLIESGTLIYDVQRCCLPRSLSREFTITRISEDQQGMILGDEFLGLPPYLWDGNRYLILVVRKGQVRRVLKAYEIRRAAGEARTLVSTFIPSTHDPLTPPEPEAGLDEAEASPESPEAETDHPGWIVPKEDVKGVAAIYGIPEDQVARIEEGLSSKGKATWMTDQDGTLSVLTLSLDSYSRLRTDEVVLRRDGPYGMLSTPVPPPPAKKKKKVVPPPPPAPLKSVSRIIDPSTELPILTVQNTGGDGVLLRLSDGTSLFLAAGQTRDVTVTPGTHEVVARFEEKPSERRTAKAHFTYHARYRLRLD